MIIEEVLILIFINRSKPRLLLSQGISFIILGEILIILNRNEEMLKSLSLKRYFLAEFINRLSDCLIIIRIPKKIILKEKCNISDISLNNRTIDYKYEIELILLWIFYVII